ncbi:LOW QUALITY PROTEIN: hypothetical protein ACHAWF_005313 [Thalassiosira exigua]
MTDSIWTAAKKTVRKDFEYVRSPALVRAGENVRLRKSVLTPVRNDIPLTKTAKDLAERNSINLEEHLKPGLSIRILQQHVQQAWRPTCAPYARVHNERSTRWAGLHEIPTGEWYYSSAKDEIYHYDNGVFEAHARDWSIRQHYFTHHVLKVIPDYSKEVGIMEDPEGYRIEGDPGNDITWCRISNKDEMEKHLMQRNKCHLQQIAYEESPPSQSFFDNILSEYGTSRAADNLLEGDVTNDIGKFPPVHGYADFDEPECLPITGMIRTDKYMEDFRSVREKTSSSLSGIHYTFWKSPASDRAMTSYLVIMIRLLFTYGFMNDR